MNASAIKVRQSLIEPLEAEARRLIDRLAALEDVARIAVMPDVHVAKDVCVGTVVATRSMLVPGAVGGDIGCGMLAVALEGEAAALRDAGRAGRVLRGLYSAAPPMRRHRRAMLQQAEDLRAEGLSHGALVRMAEDDGRLQFGTLGGGNHFVELQSDEEGRLWMMIHSGSRAMGQAIRGHHVAGAEPIGHGLVGLDAGSPAGGAYLNDLQWARRYADGNRRAMAEQVSELLLRELGMRADWQTLITCDHNHAARETHDGEALWVHRKGAMPADAGAAGVVPGSMGTASFHVIGRGHPDALRSSAHGAGRSMSRAKALASVTIRQLQHQMSGIWFDPRLTAQLREESPRAYKDVHAVMRAQQDLVKVMRTLRPVLVYKGGS
jgi:tRNA-splicing ligase RtcB (3'-phosphate/5'-hydroxy nucleic acid ligase)